MPSKNALALGCVLSGTLLLTGLRLLSESSGDADPVRERSGPPAHAPALEAALAALEAENAALRERLDAIDQRLGEVTREPAPRAPTVGPTAPEHAETASSETAGEMPPEAQLARLERVFLAEGSDGPRSFELEGSLRSALDELELSPRALSSAACGRTLCRAELVLESGADRDRILRRIPDLLPWESDGFAAVDPADPDRLIVYLTPASG